MQTVQLPGYNERVSYERLAEINDTLRKASVGYQTPADPSTGGTLNPLVPQSIENTLSSATFSAKQIVYWKNLVKTQVGQPVHEYNVIQEHGDDLDPWMAEGGVPPLNESTYSREFVEIKYLAEQRQVTDVAGATALIGPDRAAVARETAAGTIRLLQKMERSLFHADSSLTPLAFDGAFAQIQNRAPNNVTDQEGKGLSMDLLHDILAELFGAPNYGEADCIYVEPRVYKDLIKTTAMHGRHDHLSLSSGATLHHGVRNLVVSSPYGDVPIKAAPFLYTAWAPKATGTGDVNAPATPAFGADAGTAGPPAAGSSLFKSGDAGTYFYKFVAVNDKGFSAPLTSAGITVASGDAVTFEIDDDALKSGANQIRYYKVYRSALNGTADTCRQIVMVPVNADGTGGDTLITDANADRYNTSKVLITHHGQDMQEFARLLDLIRRPLAEVQTSKPFLLMLFGSLILKVPQKMWMLKNVGLAA